MTAEEAVQELTDYTTKLWYDAPQLRGRAEEIVRHVRKVLGSVRNEPAE